MREHAHPEVVEGFDPQALATNERNVVLHGVDERARKVIGAQAIMLLSEHSGAGRGDIAHLAHKLWAQVRDKKYDDVHDVEFALAQVPGLGGAIEALREVLSTLLGRQGVIETLRARRAEIEQQLGRLEGRKATTS